jgi:alpha-1,6-mannosyltransferase
MTSLPRDGSVWPLLLGGCLCAGAYAFLAFGSQAYGMARLPEFLFICGFVSLVSLGLWLMHQQQKLHISWLWVLGFALLFRAIGVFTYPVFEDDFFRYLWDGRMLVEAGSPYGVAPTEFFAADNLKDWEAVLLDRINYPNVPTVYGPVAQWFFGFCYWIGPGSLKTLQVGLALADLGVVVLLLRLASPAAVMLYAFSPLVVKEFAMSAHVDVLGVFFLVAAVVAFRRERWLWVGVLLALAAGVKVFALVAAPFLLGFKWRAWLALIVTGVAVAWPFGLLDAWFPEGLQVMGSQWLFNSPLHLWLHWGLRSLALVDPQWILRGLLLLFALLWLWQYGQWMWRWYGDANAGLTPATPPAIDQLPIYWLFGVFLLILPAINPWYLVWWLPFAVLKPLWTPWVASVVLLLSYASGINLPSPNNAIALYEVPVWVMACEFATIAVAVMVDINQWLKRRTALV